MLYWCYRSSVSEDFVLLSCDEASLNSNCGCFGKQLCPWRWKRYVPLKGLGTAYPATTRNVHKLRSSETRNVGSLRTCRRSHSFFRIWVLLVPVSQYTECPFAVYQKFKVRTHHVAKGRNCLTWVTADIF